MLSLSETQTAFAAAVLDADRPVPAGITSYMRALPEKRFNVYRNNIYASLIDVLEGRFPVVARLVGEEFFRATAKAYVSNQPPVSPVLMRYGATFAAFLDGFEPVADLPYVGDVARLEWAWNAAYHAADAEAVSIDELSDVPADQADALQFTLHPSLHIVCSLWPIVTILAANSGEEEPEPIDASAGGEDALVVRPALSVEVRRLPDGGAAFIGSIARGATIGEAADVAIEASDGFDLQANLTGLIQSGAIAAIRMS